MIVNIFLMSTYTHNVMQKYVGTGLCQISTMLFVPIEYLALKHDIVAENDF